jgi:Tfp pilus assembly protein PilZ
MTVEVAMREYIRHPADIPIECQQDSPSHSHNEIMSNISQGGLAFHAHTALEVGAVIQIRIALRQPAYQARARVAWCHPNDTGFDVGVELLDSDEVFRARMVEQLCHIEHYKQMVLRTQGRQLSGQQAALEWISKFAEQFPQTEASAAHDEHDAPANSH